MTRRVTLVDYGMCNMLNVARALKHCDADLTITEEPAGVLAAERLVLPGVGAFRDSMREIEARGLIEPILRFLETGRPFLGICIGMQILFDASEEFGEHQGLGVLSGRVRRVPNRTTDGARQRVPHIGWNHLVPPAHERRWQGTLLEPYSDQNPAVYFVHSFVGEPKDVHDRLADCVYGGHRICAAVQRGNVMATQFHPERSGEIGLNLLRRFNSL